MLLISSTTCTPCLHQHGHACRNNWGHDKLTFARRLCFLLGSSPTLPTYAFRACHVVSFQCSMFETRWTIVSCRRSSSRAGEGPNGRPCMQRSTKEHRCRAESSATGRSFRSYILRLICSGASVLRRLRISMKNFQV